MITKCPSCGRPLIPHALVCDCGHSLISELEPGKLSSDAKQSQAETSAPKATPDSFLRLARSWLLLPIAAYILSIPSLGAGALFVPIVIVNAPLGILGCFERITLNPTPDQQTAIVAIHAGFWLLFITGVSLRRRLPLGWLWSIYLILATALLMSISGCDSQIGHGLRSDGTWH
jgi:hypothetical protein